ncbi:MAG: DUF2786 domain-containing protein [Verrucomicrobia bacterium]|nr:DUF2786 domain-containing protein [Verrucomicrobiota bacterium]
MNNELPQVTPTVINRIQKLLALTESPNEHEAALALQRASDLLLKYNLTRAEVEGRRLSHNGVGERRIEVAGRITDWHKALAVEIADHCFSRCICFRRGFIFVGAPDNLEAARSLLIWTLRQLQRISLEATLEQAGRGKRAARWRFNFSLGAVLMIVRRLRSTRTVQKESDPQVPGLILVHEAAAEKYIKQNIPTKPMPKLRKARMSSALLTGMIAGEKVSLNPQGELEAARCH